MMSGFFASKQFLVAAVVAVAILAAGAGAYALSGPSSDGISLTGGCDAPVMGGAPIDVVPTDTTEPGGRRRTVAYALDAANHQGGKIDLCAVVGDIIVEPATGTRAELVFEIAGDLAEAVAATEVEARFASQGGQLLIGGWEPVVGKASPIFGSDTASARVVLRVPTTGAWAVRADAGVGDVSVSDLLVEDLDLTSDVGNLDLARVDLQGNVSLVASVGDVAAQLASVQSGRVTITSDVGDIAVRLPARVDIGYSAVGTTDVGEVELRLGPSEDYASEGDGPGERESARTAGYAAKPTQVVVEATGSVGDVRIIVE